MKQLFINGCNGFGFKVNLRLLALLVCCLGWTAFAQAQTSISGTVVDSANEPLTGVSIRVKGTTTGTISDVDGKYQLQVSEANGTLIFSYIGYNEKEVKIENRKVINVVMEDDYQNLDEVVVVGYGTMKKKDLTGAVGMINAETLAKEQPATVQDLLRTGVPGLSMGIATDTKGNAENIMIRGRNNLRVDGNKNAKTTPLFVLDGVIYNGELTDINPDDIERIDVLKDASSAAVYGAKSANGVILITTKKGKAGKPVIKFGAITGLSFVNKLSPTYKGEEYLGYRQDVMRALNPSKPGNYYDNPAHMGNVELNDWMQLDQSSGNPTAAWFNRLGFSPTELNNYLDGNVTDWEDLTYRTALSQNYSVSVSGRKDETSYYTSLNYINNESNLVGGGYSAIRARINLESKATDFLTYGINAQFAARDEGYVPVSGTAYRTISPYGDIYDKEGKFVVYPNENLNGYNPLIDRAYTNWTKDINTLNTAMFLRLNLPFGFVVESTYSPRFEWYNYLNHKSTDHPLWGANVDDKTGEISNKTETGVRENRKTVYWQWDNILRWNKEFGKHSFDATFLVNWEKNEFWSDKIISKNYQPSDVLGAHGVQWGTSSEVTSTDTQWTANAFMGRLHYTYDNRYLLTTTFRRDGYSAFGRENPYANFPSLSLGWVFSEEKFMPKAKWFDYGKLRLSWGKNGNRDINAYAAFMLLEARKYYSVDVNSGTLWDLNTYYAANMANPSLKWENTESYNLGLDLSFLSNRLQVNLDGYFKKTNDLLVQREVLDITGYTSVTSNIGEVQNTGFEALINSVNVKNKNFTWNTSFSFAYNKNKIKHLFGLMQNVYDDQGNLVGQREADHISNGWFIDKSIDEIWDYKVVGVYQVGEEEEAKQYGLVPGDFKILKKDLSTTTYSNKDKEFIGSKEPRFRLSMRNSFTFLNDFTFSFNMYSYLGHYRAFNRALNNNALINVTNQIKNDYWTANNPTNDYARLGSKLPSGISYSVWRKASFVRLDNVSLGYQVPKKWIEKVHIKGLNLNLSAKNLACFSAWPGEDPENIDANGYQRNTPITMYFGANLTF